MPFQSLVAANASRIAALSRELIENGGFDAVFVGSGAPRGKNLDIPGRQEAAANIHIGIAWLESVAFGHIERIGERVLIIGVGNTAMDYCRTSLRLAHRRGRSAAARLRGDDLRAIR